MTSSGLGFIDEQSEDGGGLFSPGSTTPGINEVNTNSVEKLTAEGDIWVYDASENKVDVKTANIQTINELSGNRRLTQLGQLWVYRPFATKEVMPTATVRISPTSDRIYTTTGAFDLFQDVNTPIFKLESTRDAQVQLIGDTNNSIPVESGSVFVSSNGGTSKGYFGIGEYDTLKPLSIVAEGGANAGIQMYVSTSDFITTESAHKPDPSNKPVPAMVIDDTNVPTFNNGLNLGQSTLDRYHAFTINRTFRTDPGGVFLSPQATLYFTVIGRIVHCKISIAFDVDGNLAAARALITDVGVVPAAFRPAGGVSANGPLFYSTVLFRENPVWAVLPDGQIRLQSDFSNTETFTVNTISVRQTLTWTRD